MAIIKSRSPFIVYLSEANLNSFSMELYIYTGTRTTDRPASPNYVLKTTAYNNEAYIDIARYIYDFIDTQFNGSYSCEAVNVDYQITRTVNNVIQSPDSFKNFDAFDGYTFGEEDQNAQFESPLLIRNKHIEKPIGENLRIPVYQGDAVEVSFFYRGDLIGQTSITATNESTDFIRYIQDFLNINGSFEDRVVSDGGFFIDAEDNPFLCLWDFSGADRILVEGSEVVEEIIIKTQQPRLQPTYKVTFLNSQGAKQDLYFFGEIERSQRVKSEKYKSNVLVNGVKQTNRHQYNKLNVNSRETILLNSGYVSEKMNPAFEDLINSSLVWITIENKVLPLELDDSTFQFKNHRRDGLIEYQINGKFAFDNINSIK